MRALAIVGPRATKKQVELFRDIRAEMSVLESPLEEDVLRALEARPDVVLIFGGDGTVNRHLRQLAKSGIPVLPLAAGSGNDLARAAGMPTVEAGLGTWQKVLSNTAAGQDVDLGMICSAGLEKPRYFSCCANIGLDADAARRTDRLPDWLKSHGGYFLGGLMALTGYEPSRMNISSADRNSDEPGWFVSVSNTPTFGGGLKIAPQASITDGRLDVTYVSAEKFSRTTLAGHFTKIFSGKHVNVAEIEIFQTTSIEVEMALPQPVYADGEYITDTPCKIDVVPRALRLISSLLL